MDATAIPYQVPQEIVDYILSFCEDDTGTLKTCSTVAKSWVISTRRLLFSSLTIGGARRVFRFRHVEPILERAESTKEQLEELDRLLQDSPEIPSEYIQSLRLRFESPATSPANYDTESNALISQILGRLQRVKTIYLHLGSWEAYPGDSSQVRESILALLRSSEIESILISNSEFLPSSLSNLITQSPSLKRLSILDPLFREDSIIPAQPSSFTAKLQYLRLDTELRYIVPTFLNESFNLKINNLRHFRVRLTESREECDLIHHLLTQASSTLEHLALADQQLFRDTPYFFPINDLTNLRTLSFIGFRANGFHSSLRWIPHVFSDVPSPLSLEEVHIATTTHRLMIPPLLVNGSIDPMLMNGDKTVGEVMLWGPLQEIDSFLATDKFPCLSKVVVTITIRDPHPTSEDEFVVKARQSFPSLTHLPNVSLVVNVGTMVY